MAGGPWQYSNAFILFLLFRWAFIIIMKPKWTMQSKKWKDLIQKVIGWKKKSWLWEVPPGIIFCPHFVGTSIIRYVKIEYYLINWLSFVTTPAFQDEEKVRATTQINNWLLKNLTSVYGQTCNFAFPTSRSLPAPFTSSGDRSAICH